MATSIRYTIVQCIAAIEDVDAKLEDVAAQPTSSAIRGTSISLGKTPGELNAERRKWVRRLLIARRRGY